MGWEYLRKMMETTYVGKRRLVGGMVANERKGCIQSDSTNADEITPKPPQKNEQNIR